MPGNAWWPRRGILTRSLHRCCCSVSTLVQLFATPMDCSMPGFPVLPCPWPMSPSLLRFMSTESVISNHLILCSFSFCLQSFPASKSFQKSQLFPSGGQSIGVSASIFPMNIFRVDFL